MKTHLLFRRFFATLLLCAVFSLSWAYDFEVDGNCYTVNEDGVSVTIESSSKSYRDLVIPSNVESGGKTYIVTDIGDNTFSYKYFTSITLPETLVTIGNRAFCGNSYETFTTIVIPNGVTVIGDDAFSNCSNLTSVTIPESVVNIGMYAFSSCSKLKYVTLSGSVAEIGLGAFSWCSSLPVEDGIRYADTYMVEVVDKTKTNYSIRSGVRNLCSFQGCGNLASISIPGSVKSIDASTFSDCSALSTLYISESVESIDESAFKGCAALNSISVAAGNPIYDSRDNCNAIINTTSNTLVVGCKGTVIPNTIAYIGKHAFEGSSITNISIPNGVVSVYKDAFRATSLKSIDIPNSVVYIGDNAFAECTALSSVTCMAESVPTLGDGVFKEGSQSTATLYVPASALTSYRSASQWRAFGNILSIDGDTPDTPEPATTFQGAKYIFGENLLQSLSDGRIHTFYYDNNGFLTRIERQDGGSIDKVFNVSYGDEITFTYSNSTYVITLNERGFVKSCDNSNDNEHAEFQYNDDDQLVYVDWDGHITNITYTDGDITRVKDGNDTYGFVYETANQGKMENKAHVMEFDRIFEVDLDYFGLLYYGGFLGKATAHLPLTRTKSNNTITSTWTLDSKGYGVKVVGSDNNTLSWSWKEGGEVVIVLATSIALDKTEASLKSGEGVQLTATVLPSKASQEVTWSSSDKSVATVSEDGYVTAVAVGTVTITATTMDGTDLSAYCTVTVTDNLSEGQCGENLFYTLDKNGNLVITGSGEMYDMNSHIVWQDYHKQIKTVSISDDATSIGGSAFCECSALTSVTIPNNVTTIGSYAFSGCTALTSIAIHKDITSIGDDAFADCSGLISISVAAANTKYDSRSDCNAIIETATNTLLVGCMNTVIPGTVKKIGDKAFSRCRSLTSISIPESVTSIGSYAFRYCSGLTAITIPGGVTSIEHDTFYGCSGLKTVTIPNGVTSIGSEAFSGCSKLESVSIPNGVAAINAKTFSGCSSLASVTIPNSVTTIGDKAFEKCSGLLSVALPRNLISIGSNAFETCSQISSIIIPNSVNSIGDAAFRYCSSLTSATLGSGLASIGRNAFRDCYMLTSIAIPEGVTNIQNATFSGCSRLTSVEIPSTASRIEVAAFYGCGLTSVTIPAAVERIGEQAFYQCASLATVTCLAKTCPATEDNIFTGLPDNAVLYVPVSAYDDYKKNSPWNTFTVIPIAATPAKSIALNIPETSLYSGDQVQLTATVHPEDADPRVTWSSSDESVATVSSEGLVTAVAVGTATITATTIDGTNLSAQCAVTVEESDVTEIISGECGEGVSYSLNSNGMFTIYGEGSIDAYDEYQPWREYVDEVKVLVISDGIESIGEGAFKNCKALTSVSIPSSVKSIGEQAFLSCSKLTSLTISDGVESIGMEAFRGCGIQSLVIPSGVVSVGQQAFRQCHALESVSIPPSLKSIESSTFQKCIKLSSVVIHEGVENIKSSAFSECRDIQSVNLPSTIKSIENNAFRLCPNLVLVRLNSNIIKPTSSSNNFTTSSPNEFKDIFGSQVEECILGGNVTSIAEYFFNDCNKLKSITIPESVKSIGENAFYGCSSLTSIAIPESVTSISQGTFYDCSSLASVKIPENVARIDSFAFFACSSLMSITIPRNVTSMGDGVFFGCSELVSLTCLSENVPVIGKLVFDYVPQSAATLYVPASALEAYKAADQWKEFGTIIPIDPSAIDELRASDASAGENSPIYNLNGCLLKEKPKSGFYIQGGKKYLAQ